MKAKPYKLTDDGGYSPCSAEEATHVELNMPCPISVRMIPVNPDRIRPPGPCWTWNGSVDSPTLSPSILSRAGGDCPVCHSFVKDGKVQFLTDSTHENAGKTLDLLEVK